MDEVRSRETWGDATIKTLLHRLMQKGAVSSRKEDGRQRYHAVLSRQAYIDGEIDALVDRLFDGRTEALAAWLTDRPQRI